MKYKKWQRDSEGQPPFFKFKALYVHVSWYISTFNYIPENQGSFFNCSRTDKKTHREISTTKNPRGNVQYQPHNLPHTQSWKASLWNLGPGRCAGGRRFGGKLTIRGEEVYNDDKVDIGMSYLFCVELRGLFGGESEWLNCLVGWLLGRCQKAFYSCWYWCGSLGILVGSRATDYNQTRGNYCIPIQQTTVDYSFWNFADFLWLMIYWGEGIYVFSLAATRPLILPPKVILDFARRQGAEQACGKKNMMALWRKCRCWEVTDQ